mgnify:CR=1 FL=1
MTIEDSDRRPARQTLARRLREPAGEPSRTALSLEDKQSLEAPLVRIAPPGAQAPVQHLAEEQRLELIHKISTSGSSER